MLIHQGTSPRRIPRQIIKVSSACCNSKSEGWLPSFAHFLELAPLAALSRLELPPLQLLPLPRPQTRQRSTDEDAPLARDHQGPSPPPPAPDTNAEMPAHPSSPCPASAPTGTTQDTTTTLHLGKIKVTAAAAPTTNTTAGHVSSKRQAKPFLTVSSTLLLGLPPPQQSGTGGWKTATELCEASKRGEVFIAKAGSCEIGFETRVDGVAVVGGGGEGVEMEGEGGVMGLAGACAVCFVPFFVETCFGVVLMVGGVTDVGRCWAGVEGEAWRGRGDGGEGVVLFASQGFGVRDGQGGVGEGAGCGV